MACSELHRPSLAALTADLPDLRVCFCIRAWKTCPALVRRLLSDLAATLPEPCGEGRVLVVAALSPFLPQPVCVAFMKAREGTCWSADGSPLRRGGARVPGRTEADYRPHSGMCGGLSHETSGTPFCSQSKRRAVPWTRRRRGRSTCLHRHSRQARNWTADRLATTSMAANQAGRTRQHPSVLILADERRIWKTAVIGREEASPWMGVERKRRRSIGRSSRFLNFSVLW
jgi:hypothetical protein